MNKRATVVILVGLLCLTGIAYAGVSANYDLSWNVIGGGGGPMESASYAMRSTVGQIIGLSSSNNCQLGAGYWYGTGVPSKNVEVTVSTDKMAYSPGDTMTTTIGFKNPSSSSMDTLFAWYLHIPAYNYWGQVYLGVMPLPANYDESFKIPIDVGDWGTTGLEAEWHVWLVEPSPPYAIISHDSVDWRYLPGRMAQSETMPVEIPKEIAKGIEGVELPGKKAQGEVVPVEIVGELTKEKKK